MNKPIGLKPVLAKIQHQSSLGIHEHFEVVWYDDMYTNEWKSYGSSSTFDDGEKVIAWTYTDEVPMMNDGEGDDR